MAAYQKRGKMSMGKAHALREAASRSALDELILRPPPRMPGRIPVHPDTDGAAILARVMAGPPVDDDDGDQSAAALEQIELATKAA
jgi:hypothetical protein